MKTIIFEHRHRIELEERIQQAMEQLAVDRSELATRAILFARRLWRKGKWHPTRKSPFLVRLDKTNKVTVIVSLKKDIHLYMEKMARALRISFAEMLRLALDVMLSYLLRDGPGIVHDVVSKQRITALRVRGINVLDHIDHAVWCINSVIDFSICNIHRTDRNKEPPDGIKKL